jgi:lipopolysaccharide biosynthesis regulator YciM
LYPPPGGALPQIEGSVMFSRIHFTIFILIIIFFGYLFFLNPEEVDFTLYQDHTLSMSPALIAFGAFFIGAFFVFIVTLFVDTKRAFDLWRSSKQQKKEELIRERYSDALEEMMKGNVSKAKEILGKIIEKNPQYLSSYLSLAKLHSFEGHHDLAIDILIRAKAIDPDNLELLFDLQKSYHARKEYALAHETLDYILDRDPANREALRQKREIFFQQGKWPEAYEAQKNLMKYTKEKDQAQIEKKILLGLEYRASEKLAQNGTYKEAEKTLREIIREDREFVPAYVTLGDALQSQGSSDDASQIWIKGLESSWNPIFLERLESLYLSMASPKKILNLYLDYLRKRPEDSILRFFYSRLLIRLEMIDEALQQLRDLETAGEAPFAELYILMGQAYHRHRDFQRSIQAYQKALEVQKFSIPSYTCSACGKFQREWSGFCEQCHTWGTFTVKIPEAPKKMPAIPFYDYPVKL